MTTDRVRDLVNCMLYVAGRRIPRHCSIYPTRTKRVKFLVKTDNSSCLAIITADPPLSITICTPQTSG